MKLFKKRKMFQIICSMEATRNKIMFSPMRLQHWFRGREWQIDYIFPLNRKGHHEPCSLLEFEAAKGDSVPKQNL